MIVLYYSRVLFHSSIEQKNKRNKIKIKKLSRSPRFHNISHPSKLYKLYHIENSKTEHLDEAVHSQTC